MAAATNGLPEDPALLRARLVEVEARYAQSQVQFRELRTWYDKLKRHHRELLWSEAVLAREGLEEAMPGPPIADADRANGHIGGGFVLRHHLGAGAFATVYAAIDKEGRPCAVKRIDLCGNQPVRRECRCRVDGVEDDAIQHEHAVKF